MTASDDSHRTMRALRLIAALTVACSSAATSTTKNVTARSQTPGSVNTMSPIPPADEGEEAQGEEARHGANGRADRTRGTDLVLEDEARCEHSRTGLRRTSP